MVKQLSMFSGFSEDQAGAELLTEAQHQEPRFSCRFCQDTGKLGDYAFCWCEAGQKAAAIRRQKSVIEDARSLSSGTLARLTGLRRYVELERIRSRFVDFITAQDDCFETWQDAWNAFKIEQR